MFYSVFHSFEVEKEVRVIPADLVAFDFEITGQYPHIPEAATVCVCLAILWVWRLNDA